MPSSKAMLRPVKRADGTTIHQLNIRVVIERRSKFISLRETIAPSDFDPASGAVKKSHPNYKYLNVLIGKKTAELNDVFRQLMLGDGEPTLEAFNDLYCKDRTRKTRDFYRFVEKINQVKNKRGVRQKTLISFAQGISKLREFRAQLFLNEINVELVEEFEGFLLEECGYAVSTAGKHLRTLRMYVRIAFGRGLMRSNPFFEFKIKGSNEFKMPLRLFELNRIAELPAELDLTGLPGLSQSLDRFLFQCCTSLAFADLESLRWSDITQVGIIKPRTKRTSSSQVQVIPLLPLAKEILERRRTLSKTEFVFDPITNQKYNMQLHKIEELAKLQRPLTSHIARHTFGTLALQAGMKKEVVKDIMGITEDKTLRFYQRIAEGFKKEEINKLEAFAVFSGSTKKKKGAAA